MGAFTHEVAAVDPVHGHIYLTEDLPDSNLYRFVPDHYPESGRPQLESGRLQAAIVNGDNPFSFRSISWATVTYPVPQLSIKPDGSAQLPTRKQVTNAEKFNGGEGCWFHNGIVYFQQKAITGFGQWIQIETLSMLFTIKNLKMHLILELMMSTTLPYLRVVKY